MKLIKVALFAVWLVLAFIAGAGTVRSVQGSETSGLLKFHFSENGREGRATCTGNSSAVTGGNRNDGTVYVTCITR